MANRSYLYTTDNLPESAAWSEQRKLLGISEWNYDIPLSFKLLLTGNPRAVISSIWETPEKIALAGDAAKGLENLFDYLGVLPNEAAPLVNEARDFLFEPSNRRQYFVLECGEIFDIQGGSLEAQNLALKNEIEQIATHVKALPVPVPRTLPKPGSSVDRPFRQTKDQKPVDPLEPFYHLGLGHWSNILYFHFAEEEA